MGSALCLSSAGLTSPTVQEQSVTRPLIVVAGFIHDVSDFIDEHPGGRHLIIKYIGKDATPAFFGGVYDHSNAAHNVCSFLRCWYPCTDVSAATLDEARRRTPWPARRGRKVVEVEERPTVPSPACAIKHADSFVVRFRLQDVRRSRERRVFCQADEGLRCAR